MTVGHRRGAEPAMGPFIEIAGRRIGRGEPVFVVAELSANHHQSFDRAVELVEAARKAGADAIKLQTYTPDTLTLDTDAEPFRIPAGNTWEGETLYELYSRAYTPWEWQPDLKGIAEKLGLICFSSPFDRTAVDFLAEIEVPAYKIASFELVDLPLIEYVARQGKPLILSTGLSTLSEVDEAVRTARGAGAEEVALLKCVSAYPAPPDQMHLRTIPHMARTFGVPTGLSDHTLGSAAAVAAVALGACIVEKHFTLSREDSGPDAGFSLEPSEFETMVRDIRLAEQALGEVTYEPTPDEEINRVFRRSLFVVEHIEAGEPFNMKNVRSVRPGDGLPPRFLEVVLGRRASRDIAPGTPLGWDHIAGDGPS